MINPSWHRLERLSTIAIIECALVFLVAGCGAEGTGGDSQQLDEQAQALLEQGQYSKVLPDCLKAVELDPELAEAYDNLGNVLIHSGQDEAAVAYFKKALELEPDYEDARTALRNLGAQ